MEIFKARLETFWGNSGARGKRRVDKMEKGTSRSGKRSQRVNIGARQLSLVRTRTYTIYTAIDMNGAQSIEMNDAQSIKMKITPMKGNRAECLYFDQ